MSDLTIVPIESSMFALLGLGQLLRTVAKVRRAHAPDMMVMALSTLYTARQNLDKNIRSKVLEKFTEDFVFNTTIPRAVAVGAFAFRKLVSEIREVMGDEENRSEAARRRTR